MNKSEIEALTNVKCAQPHSFLGMHPYNKGAKKDGDSCLVVRAYLDDAKHCEVVDVTKPDGPRYKLERLTDDGLFEGFIDGCDQIFPYRLRTERYNGEIRQFFDPYSFLPTLSEQDVYLFSEGTDHFVHKKMGAHLRTVDGVIGVSFAV